MTKREKLGVKQVEGRIGKPWHTSSSIKKDLDFLLQLIKRYLNGQKLD